MSSVYRSNVKAFLKSFETNKASLFPKIGQLAVDNVIAEAPVDTGALKAANDYQADTDMVVVYNTEIYAPHVEYGTYKQSANPFMRRGLNKSRSGILNLITKELSV